MNKEKLLEWLKSTYNLSSAEAKYFAKEDKPFLEGLKLGESGFCWEIIRLIEQGYFDE